MQTKQKLILLVLVVIMGSMSIASCGSNDDDILSTGDYTIGMKISEMGTLTDTECEKINKILPNMSDTLKNVTEIAAKAAFEISWGILPTSAFDLSMDYNLEYYLKDSLSNTIAAHNIFVKDGKLTKK